MKRNTYLTITALIACIFLFLSACGSTSEETEPKDTDSSKEMGTEDNTKKENASSEESADTNNNDDGHSESIAEEDTNNENPDGNTSSDNTASEENAIEEKESSEASSNSNSKMIESGNSAIEYLKNQLKSKNQKMNLNDLEFDDMGGKIQNDEKGQYYSIKMTSKSLQEDGGSGTVGIYKVYQDGTYKLLE
jgi:flagellar biosynthesis GTPase FlhF